MTEDEDGNRGPFKRSWIAPPDPIIAIEWQLAALVALMVAFVAAVVKASL